MEEKIKGKKEGVEKDTHRQRGHFCKLKNIDFHTESSNNILWVVGSWVPTR